jgi:heme A synthase
MRLSGNAASLQQRVLWRLFLMGAALLAMTWGLFADTPAGLQAEHSPGCYCRCAPSRGLNSCIKMCERPKYAARWWAVSCKKPREHSPVENPGAGPHLHHADRAEHARL